MQPLYFNPPIPTSNYTGTNPLTDYNIATHQMQPSYFNPNLYNSFTFNRFPQQPVNNLSTLGSMPLGSNQVSTHPTNAVLGTSGFDHDQFGYITLQYISTLIYFSTQASTFFTNYASYGLLQPIAFSFRFSTELQTLYFSEYGATDFINTYVNTFTQEYDFYSNAVLTYFTDMFTYQYVTQAQVTPLGSTVFASGLSSQHIDSSSYYPTSTYYPVGSSMFVNMLGSNVYTGLLVTTNSIIIFQNEQVSSYYSQSLSYQVNIANLTAALNSVSGTGTAAEGQGNITVTTFSWTWTSVPGTGWTGSQVTQFPNFLFTTVVNSYLFYTYGGTVITASSIAVTQVQSLITVQNNYLSNSQTFLNNAVTTLQSQVSLAGQIIGSLASATQAIISNIT